MLGRISVGKDLKRKLQEERLEDETRNLDVAGDKPGEVN